MKNKVSILALVLLALSSSAMADGVRLSFPVSINCAAPVFTQGNLKGSQGNPVSTIIEKDGKTTVTFITGFNIPSENDFGKIKHVGDNYGASVKSAEGKTVVMFTPSSEEKTSFVIKDISNNIVTTEIKATDCTISHPNNGTDTKDFE